MPSKDDLLEPLFMDISLFDRERTDSWTMFELALMRITCAAPGARGLKFSEKLAIVDAMRDAGLLLLQRIEDR